VHEIRYDAAATLFFGADPQINGFQRPGQKTFGTAAPAIKYAIEEMPIYLHGTRLAIDGRHADLSFEEILQAYESVDFSNFEK
jgi:hypothetical protein